MKKIRRFLATLLLFGSTVEATGEELTTREMRSLSMSVGKCWVVDLSSKSADITVTLSADMQPNGTVVVSSIRLLSFNGGSGRDVTKAFEAAKRALIRCQRSGYALPTEKYQKWRKIELTFDPN